MQSHEWILEVAQTDISVYKQYNYIREQKL